MATGVKPRIKAPKTAGIGDVITLKTLISHQMESGQRRDETGTLIARRIINRFTCDFNGEMVIDVSLGPSMSSNPFLQFQALVPGAGDFTFTWYDDDGSIYRATKPIRIG